jgi:hypothetical protein
VHKEELHNLYFPPITVRVVKPKKKRWTEYLARMGEINKYKTSVETPEKK